MPDYIVTVRTPNYTRYLVAADTWEQAKDKAENGDNGILYLDHEELGNEGEVISVTSDPVLHEGEETFFDIADVAATKADHITALFESLAKCEAVLSQLQDAMPLEGMAQSIMVQGYVGNAIVTARMALVAAQEAVNA